MKHFILILFVALQGCLFFNTSETSTDSNTPDQGKDSLPDAPHVDLLAPDQGKDLSDLSSADARIDGGKLKCSNNAECNKNKVCTNNACVCKLGELNGTCKPVCENSCAQNERCVNRMPDNVCACKVGFEKENGKCIFPKIVKNVTRLDLTTIADRDTQSSELPFSAVDYKQVVPFLSGRSTTYRPEDAHFLPEITKSGVIFSRVGTRKKITIAANMVEFDKKHVEVFKGALTLDATQNNEEVSITGVIPEKSFLVFYTSFDSEGNSTNILSPDNTSLRGIISQGKITFSRMATAGKIKVRWYLVVSKGEAFTVDHHALTIAKDRKNSNTLPSAPNPFLLWSNQTSRMVLREGNARCQYVPIVQAGAPLVRCSRGDKGTDLELSQNAIEIALQIVHFKNPKLKVTHFESTITGDVLRNIILNNLAEKDTALLGQMGSAGNITIGEGTPNSNRAHPAMGSVRITKDDTQQDVIEIKRESEHRTAKASIQYITWY